MGSLRIVGLMVSALAGSLLDGCSEWDTGEGWYACGEGGRDPVCTESLRRARIECACPGPPCYPQFAEPTDCNGDGRISKSLSEVSSESDAGRR